MNRPIWKSVRYTCWLVVVGCSLTLRPAQAQFTNLHSFTGGSADGANPSGALVLSGPTLFGTAATGGPLSNGVVFAINTDGSGYTNLHSFAGGSADGANPSGALILSGPTLFGTAATGGPLSNGVVFAINTDGSGYTNLHSFGDLGDGADPNGSLTLDGTSLYGLTSLGNFGGTFGLGAVFAINTDGSGYNILKRFNNIWSGGEPHGSLTLSGTTLYGMTAIGSELDDTTNRVYDYSGSLGFGLVFAINTDGSGYTNLHSFVGGSNDGANPNGSLALSGTTLYGTTWGGGTTSNGVVFAINTDGSGYTNLYSFAGGTGDGANPNGSLLLSGTTLYGTTSSGGVAGQGVLFAINTDGSDYTILHSFVGTDDGAKPNDLLLLNGTTLYGTTAAGGPTGQGVVFAYGLTEGTIVVQPTPSNGGTVSPGGSYAIGVTQTISATANNGWIFTGWSDGNAQNPRTITVSTGEQIYSAIFSRIPTTADSISFLESYQDKIVENGYGGYTNEPAGRFSIRAVAFSGAGLSPANLNANSPVAITVGHWSFNGILGDDTKYRPGTPRADLGLPYQLTNGATAYAGKVSLVFGTTSALIQIDAKAGQNSQRVSLQGFVDSDTFVGTANSSQPVPVHDVLNATVSIGEFTETLSNIVVTGTAAERTTTTRDASRFTLNTIKIKGTAP